MRDSSSSLLRVITTYGVVCIFPNRWLSIVRFTLFPSETNLNELKTVYYSLSSRKRLLYFSEEAQTWFSQRQRFFNSNLISWNKQKLMFSKKILLSQMGSSKCKKFTNLWLKFLIVVLERDYINGKCWLFERVTASRNTNLVLLKAKSVA